MLSIKQMSKEAIRGKSLGCVVPLLAMWLLFCPKLMAQKLDSLMSKELETLVVSARRMEHLSVLPPQRLSGVEIKRLSSLSVADALRYFSGLQIKDYGGVGGIKTVNIRSMGSHHVGIYYDGIALGNAQNGQVDLGQYSLDNIELIRLYNGQKGSYLQPARDFGHSGSIYIQTRRPRFVKGKRLNTGLRFKTGSFGLVNPSTTLAYQLNQKLSATLSTEWLKANGRYKFRYRKLDAEGKKLLYDTLAYRENGDIEAFRIESALLGKFKGGDFHIKAYHYDSERGIPGAIVNNKWKRGERLWDNNSFAQGSFKYAIGRYSTSWKLKYAHYRTRFLRDDEQELFVDNSFRQNEFYLSSANAYKLARSWYVSLAYDYIYHNLWSDMPKFIKPYRHTQMLAVSSTYSGDWGNVQASLLGTFILDKNRTNSTVRQRQALSPALLGSIVLMPRLRLNAFVKRSFRMPTFNDLYYTEIGNSKLEPEYTTQYNLGLAWQGQLSLANFKSYSLRLEAYHNDVQNKIVAYPKGQQFRWTMLNLGEVSINGLEAIASLETELFKDLNLKVKAQYTYQKALDITNKSDSYYRHQIPYVPEHSGSLVAMATYKAWELNYSFIYAGERYNAPENIIYNYVQPWYTSDLSVAYNFALWQAHTKVQLECNNVFGQDYEVISNYPMPKQNFRLVLSLDF